MASGIQINEGQYDFNDHSQRNFMPAIAIPIEVITTVLLWIRIVNRFVTNSKLGFDDYLIIAAWVLGVGLTAAILLCTEQYGFDRHIWDTPDDIWWKGGLAAWMVEVTFFWSTCFTKVSVLMFYRRLVAGTVSRRFKMAIWAAIGFVVIYTISFSLTIVFTCLPVHAIWKQYDLKWVATHDFKCTPLPRQEKVAKLLGALSVVTDFYSVMLPAVLVSQIRLTNRQRYGLFVIFGLGFLVVGAGIARTYYLGRAFAEAFDKPWPAFDVFIASIIETNIAIVCACAPSLKALFGKFFANAVSRYDSSKGSGGYSRGRFHFNKSSSGNSTEASANLTQRGNSLRHKASNRSLGRDRVNAGMDEKRKGNSFKATHEYGKDYAETIAVGYGEGLGENLKLPNPRRVSPMDSSQLFDETFRLPDKLPGTSAQKRGPIQETYYISPSPSASSDDEISLVMMAPNAESHRVYDLPETPAMPPPLSIKRSASNPDRITSVGMFSPSNVGPSSRPSTSKGSVPQSPWSQSSFLREDDFDQPPMPDPLLSPFRPRARRKLSKEKWDQQIRFNAI